MEGAANDDCGRRPLSGPQAQTDGRDFFHVVAGDHKLVRSHCALFGPLAVTGIGGSW